MADIFISYKREEKEQAQRLHDALEQFGFTVWFDVELLSGDEFRPVIVEMIDKCKAVVVLWSPLAVTSQFVVDEAGYAQRKGKLCPAMLSPCDLPFGFGGTHADSLEGWTGQLRHEGFNRLLGSIEQKTGKQAQLGASNHETAQQKAEIQDFQAVAKLRSAAAWKTFLKDYPGTSFRRFIEGQMKELKAQQTSTAPSASRENTGTMTPSVALSRPRPLWIYGGLIALALVFAGGVGAVSYLAGKGEGSPKRSADEPDRINVVERDDTPLSNPTASPEAKQSGVQGDKKRKEADEAAWNIAKTLGTITVYENYEENEAFSLYKAEAKRKIEAHRSAIRDLQTELMLKGFYKSPVDGFVGKGTISAVYAFKQASSEPVPSVNLEMIETDAIYDLTKAVKSWSRPVSASSGSRSEADASTGTAVDGLTATPPASPGAKQSGVQITPVQRAIEAAKNGEAVEKREFRDTLKSGGTGPEMVVVPPGRFVMGSPDSEEGRDDREGPVRTVTISKPFAVGKYEVTWAEWEACVSAEGCDGAVSQGSRSDEGGGMGNHPVSGVSWEDAQAYIKWLNREVQGSPYRLLSEAEWEYAARAGTASAYWWGPTASHAYANYGKDQCCGGLASGRDKWVNTAPVGSFPSNNFGLYDMHGNIAEWVEDCYENSYDGAPSDGSARESCSNELAGVMRGGNATSNPKLLRSALRLGGRKGTGFGGVGFRVARDFNQ